MLSEEHIRIIKANLIDYFDKTEPYLNPDLSMDMLSKALGFPKHHITEVLNKEIGKNFFQFVNEHRVEAVKDMLSANKNYFSIEAIGYECGFNSKSSFFTIFKKATGQTPLQFKNSNL
jgi:AraC-like DNA-binding protein